MAPPQDICGGQRTVRPALAETVGLAGLMVLVVCIIYWPALRGAFIWDDRLLVDKNPLVTGKAGPFSIWFQTDFPLTLTSLWVESLIFGKTPEGFHVVNVVMHCLSALLVWRVLLRLRIQGAWLGALLFAIHPVCAASAGWISEQKN